MTTASFAHYETPLHELPFTALDLETTGYSPPLARITEIAMIPMGKNAGDPFQTLIDPGVSIPREIIELTGITNAMVQGKPSIEEVFPTIKRLLYGTIFVSHNVPFDWNFIDHAFRCFDSGPLSMPSLCTLHLSRKYLKKNELLTSHKLESVARHLSVDLKGAHRAMADTKAVYGLMKHFLADLDRLGMKTGGDLVKAGLIKLVHDPKRSRES
ncbi:MAG: 3'-5' exonuclease [Candidatus Ozemobacteraceae bacterium]